MQETERANALLGRYFAPDVRDEIEQSEIDLVEQEPRDLEVVIMFTDIVGFTKLSEKMEPKDVMIELRRKLAHRAVALQGR